MPLAPDFSTAPEGLRKAWCAGRDRVGTLSSMRSRLSLSVIGGRHMKLLSELAHDHFLPEPDSPELGPFTRAFMHMMFAHVEFERRLAELADMITLTPGFGETELLGSARERPKSSRRCAPKITTSILVACRRLTTSRNFSMRHPDSATSGTGWRMASGGELTRSLALSMCTPFAFERGSLPAASSPSTRSSRSLNLSRMLRSSSGSCSGRSRLACRRSRCRPNCRPQSSRARRGKNCHVTLQKPEQCHSRARLAW